MNFALYKREVVALRILSSFLRLSAFVVLTLVMVGGASAAHAEETVWVTGRVLDDDGSPKRNALVAVYDDHNKIVDYARTDNNGAYALAVPRHVLHLAQKHGKGFVAEVFGTMTRFVGGAAGFVASPVRAGMHAITSSQAAQFTDPLTRGGIAAGTAVADKVLDVLSPRSHHDKLPEARLTPGVLLLKVVAPDCNDLVSLGQIYWVQEEKFRAGGRSTQTLAAWLDPIQLAPSRTDRASRIQNDYLRFTSARLEPSLAQPGDHVRISAHLLTPPEPTIYAVVVARNSRTGQKWELLPVGNGRYEGEFVVDKRFPRDDQVISILAYADNEQRQGRREQTERAIEGEGVWTGSKPFVYDPLLVVSRNRADLTLTVINPRKSH